MLRPAFARCVLVLCVLLFTTGSAFARKAKLSQSVVVLGKHLALKHNKTGRQGQYQVVLAQYVAPRESLQDWSLMFAVRKYKGTIDVGAYISGVVTNIRDRKTKGDRLANAVAFESTDGRSYIVDILLSEGTLVEHSVWRYTPTPDGMLAYQIARRVDAEKESPQAAKDLIESINDQRPRIVTQLNRQDLPTPR